MRILVDILHPKQVHFFRPLIQKWQNRGDVIQITTRDKDITNLLMDRYGFSYVCISKQKKSLGMALELSQRWIKMFTLIRDFRPDISMSVTGISTTLPARMLGIPNIAFTDTETATISNQISFPFADCILTPEWFLKDFGANHYRYKGFHEWCYLHPNEFSADARYVELEGLDPAKPYAVVRFVRWDALHDQRERGLSSNEKVELVQGLAKHMQVILSCEFQLPAELHQYKRITHIENIHHIMAFSKLVVGESPSMSTEAALLAIPTVLSSTWAVKAGNMQILENKYHLMRVFENGRQALDEAFRIAQHPPSKADIQMRRLNLTKQLDYIPDVVDAHIQRLVREK